MLRASIIVLSFNHFIFLSFCSIILLFFHSILSFHRSPPYDLSSRRFFVRRTRREEGKEMLTSQPSWYDEDTHTHAHTRRHAHAHAHTHTHTPCQCLCVCVSWSLVSLVHLRLLWWDSPFSGRLKATLDWLCMCDLMRLRYIRYTRV